MIPRLGDGNPYNESEMEYANSISSLEIDSPSRGRKRLLKLLTPNVGSYISLEIDSPSRGRKLALKSVAATEVTKFRN